jgi:uncharacterized protein
VNVLHLLVLLAAGCGAGFLAGFFGVGGGLILVPILLLFYAMTGTTSLISTQLAFGTSLLIIIFASTASAIRYAQNKHVIWSAVWYLGAGSVLGGFGGAYIAGGLEGHVLRQIFSVIVLIAAVELLVSGKKIKGEQFPKPFPPALLLSGVCIGIVSAMAGVGGAIVSIPIMHSIFRFPFKKALGTSSATIVITALAGVAGYAVQGWGNFFLPPGTIGFVDYVHALPLIAGSIPLAVVGANLAHKTEPRRLTTLFAVFLVVVGFRMFFF